MNTELKEFELMRKTAELRALSKISLERPLDTGELNKITELKEEIFGE
jgi:hypothetical protein